MEYLPLDAIDKVQSAILHFQQGWPNYVIVQHLQRSAGQRFPVARPHELPGVSAWGEGQEPEGEDQPMAQKTDKKEDEQQETRGKEPAVNRGDVVSTLSGVDAAEIQRSLDKLF